MARTGIKIQISDSVLGAPLDVNATTMIFSSEDTPTQDVISGRSLDELKSKGLDASSALYAAAQQYFNPSPTVSLDGNLLWVYGDIDVMTGATNICEAVRKTVANSFDERPRQLVFLARGGDDTGFGGANKTTAENVIQAAISQLATEGIRVVAIVATPLDGGEGEDINSTIVNADDITKWNAPFVAVCPMSASVENKEVFGAVYVASTLATISVGTSIGDGGLSAIQTPSILAVEDDFGEMYGSVDVRTLSLAQVDMLGEKGYLFTRTRPPRNGLWWNDGATCNDPDNALSSLEACRTICTLADALQSFFVPYINTRVPVDNNGNIQSTYKQVVLDAARASVIQPYIDSGDISDARIDLVAKDNDFIGTRTWEVTLSILPASTLRWIDGYVFYVKNLS